MPSFAVVPETRRVPPLVNIDRIVLVAEETVGARFARAGSFWSWTGFSGSNSRAMRSAVGGVPGAMR